MSNDLITLFSDTFNTDLLRCIISSPRRRSQEIKKVIIRPIIVKDEVLMQFEYHHEKKVTHENLRPEDTAEKAFSLVSDHFKQINIFTATEEIQVLASKADNPRIKHRKIQNAAVPSETTASFSTGGRNTFLDAASANILAHDRKKNYIIKEGEPCPFLVKLGVMDENGNVFKRHYSKFRQINRFLEIVRDAYKDLPAGSSADSSAGGLKVIDFGCGKAYLTFALYYYFTELCGIRAEIIGLDLKEDVIEFCGKVAKELGYDGLTFKHGDIADYTDDGCDMVVTLHACDTATDFALINAVKWNAPVILSVPCCQHELFKQIKNREMQPMLRHGIIKDKFTELLTDSLRALALEAKGYDVAMVEFTTLEHTQKNIMLRAVRKRAPEDQKSKRALDEYRALEKRFCVSCTINRML